MKPVDPTFQLIGFMLAIGLPTLSTLIALLINNTRLNDVNNRISDLRTYVDQRLSATEALFTERLRRVEDVFDARLTRIEQELKIR